MSLSSGPVADVEVIVGFARPGGSVHKAVRAFPVRVTERPRLVVGDRKMGEIIGISYQPYGHDCESVEVGSTLEEYPFES